MTRFVPATKKQVLDTVRGEGSKAQFRGTALFVKTWIDVDDGHWTEWKPSGDLDDFAWDTVEDCLA